MSLILLKRKARLGKVKGHLQGHSDTEMEIELRSQLCVDEAKGLDLGGLVVLTCSPKWLSTSWRRPTNFWMISSSKENKKGTVDKFCNNTSIDYRQHLV